MKVYVDTCLLSGIVNKDISKRELKSIEVLCDSKDVELCTSKKTLDEFLKAKDYKQRVAFKLLYKIITKIPSENLIIQGSATWGSVPWGAATWGDGCSSENKIFAKLKKLFKPDDAEHIFQAVNAKCDYFLTLDNRTILLKNNKYELAKIAPGTKLVSPNGLAVLL